MKPIPLTIACLAVLSMRVSAQLPHSVLLDDSKSTSFVYDKFKPALCTQSSDEFAPLTNEPFFMGGEPALEQHVKSLRLYPRQARMMLTEGTVRVRFRVQADGHLTDIQVTQSRGTLLDVAAVRAVALMPRWYPAHRSGIAVSCLIELPITFRLY